MPDRPYRAEHVGSFPRPERLIASREDFAAGKIAREELTRIETECIEDIVSIALQEDVALVGLSILSGAHMHICPRVMELLKEKGLEDVQVVIGGIIPEQDFEFMKKSGVAGIFNPGTPMDEIVQFIRSNIKPRGVVA